MSQHQISATDAGVLTQNYQDANINTAIGGSFSRDAFDEILAQSGCESVRYYFALDSNSKLKIVTCGIDANGNDMLSNDKIMEMSIICPPMCGGANILNHL